MTVTVYRSTDAGAPTLNGIGGSFINVLTACLVDGYGSKVGAGWTKPYSMTGAAAFKMPAGTNGHYIRVEDTDSSFVSMQGFTEMTGISTGLGQFPAPRQGNGSYPGRTYLYRTSQGSGSPSSVPWVLVTNGSLILFWCNTARTWPVLDSTQAHSFVFGQILSKASNDPYSTVLIANPSPDGGGSVVGQLNASANAGAMPGHYIARNFTQTGPSAYFGKCAESALVNNSNMGSTGLSIPNPVDGKVYISAINVFETIENTTTAWRGTIPGLYAPCFRAVNLFNDGDQLTNVEGFEGRVFEAHPIYSNMVLLFEVSNTW